MACSGIVLKELWRGATIYRALFNDLVCRRCGDLSGHALDIAGGDAPRYRMFLPESLTVMRTDYHPFRGVEKVVDMNAELPFGDGEFDAVFLFNALYIAERPEKLISEACRVLVPGGRLFVSTPLIANEMPEPRDYVRLTHDGLLRLMSASGFSTVEIVRFGERFTSAMYLLHPFFLAAPVRFAAYLLALGLDTLVPHGMRERHPTPVGYFCIVKK